jgi:hypothetical protein
MPFRIVAVLAAKVNVRHDARQMIPRRKTGVVMAERKIRGEFLTNAIRFLFLVNVVNLDCHD